MYTYLCTQLVHLIKNKKKITVCIENNHFLECIDIKKKEKTQNWQKQIFAIFIVNQEKKSGASHDKTYGSF